MFQMNVLRNVLFSIPSAHCRVSFLPIDFNNRQLLQLGMQILLEQKSYIELK